MKNTRIILWTLLLLGMTDLCQTLRAERGVASYYHNRFHGRRMANGDYYHRDSFTCAHRRYPFGTWLRVENARNGKAVVVQVTDRGPYSKRYTIDLSRAAAEQLDIIQSGWAPVEITKVPSRDSGVIPFRMAGEDEEELITIDLDFVPAPQYELPEWDTDKEE